jgi:hypothetical protein
MASMQGEVFAAFRAMDVPEDKAMAATAALSRRNDDVTALRSEMVLTRWMVVTNIAISVAILLKLLVH